MNYRPLLLPCLLFFVFATNSCVAQNTQSTDMTEITQPGMAHTVYFWLQEGLSEDELQSFEAGMRSLAASPTVRRVFVGKPAATPSRGVVDNSFDYSLVLWFDDVAGHDAYQVSPAHLKFVEDHEAKFKEVCVFDNDVLE
ncbi:Dabb family protein [Neolewinella litorea]|uniref:Dabb family protein n=1 Tax=Neolewinella litorea TaxID=2562452 RepID=A0A4S4NMX8_9BACT|nr:Dabb family protein [Neolewinella litorea]THH41182.1 Dabb family protein [Neolewinella litorea]